ncbi:MAG: thiolase family protein [Myxococcota bacterium]|nr:thiolase family protein [Myxococcota bacterium]
MREVAIVAAKRSPIARIRGALSSVRPDDLAALAIRAALESANLEGAEVDEVIFGCANQAGEDNRNVARMATVLAGLPFEVPAITVNRLCASGLSAVNAAARLIRCGDAEVVIAGGVESMSRAPLVFAKGAVGFASGNLTGYDSSLGWRFPNPKMKTIFPLEGMGETAENLVERYQISREAQDRFALASHTRALAAISSGAFDAETFPVEVPQRKKPPVLFSQDEGPRAGSSLEKLATLRAVFRDGGSVTAGNSSTLNDGSAALVLMERRRAEAEGREILALWEGSASAGVDPRYMGIGPVPATERVLKRVGWSLDELALIELNEAFAAQSLAVLQGLGLTEEDATARVNVNGGAIALGHPLGASGARILITLIHALRARGGGRGLASLCVGVGQGVASLVTVP